MKHSTITLLAMVLTAISITLGCVGSSGKYRGYTRLETPDGIVYERDSSTQGHVTAPNNANEASPFTVDGNGVNAASAGVWQKTVGQIAAGQSGTLYLVGSLIAVAGAVAFWLGQKALALGLAIAGTGIILMPFVGPIIAPWIAGIVVISILAGIALLIWKLGWWRAREVEKDVTVAKAVQLAKNGDKSGALNVAATLPRWRKQGA